MHPLTPAIHPAGTPSAKLAAGWKALHDGVQATVTAIHELDFNSRDYYSADPNAWNEAVAMMRDYESVMRTFLSTTTTVRREIAALIEQNEKRKEDR